MLLRSRGFFSVHKRRRLFSLFRGQFAVFRGLLSTRPSTGFTQKSASIPHVMHSLVHRLRELRIDRAPPLALASAADGASGHPSPCWQGAGTRGGGRRDDRKSVVEGKSGSGSGDHGGR